MERLDKILASQGRLSRREVRALIRQGRVLVDGAPAASPDEKVDPAKSGITLDGRPICYRKYLYLMMNKPAGVISASSDPKCPTAVDLVPPEYQRAGLFPAGRLDKDTTGFLLITDDGDFAHRMLAPKRHVPKTYHATLDAMADESQCARFEGGLTLADGFTCLPAKVRMLPGEEPVAEVVLHEGKYHQVKRMFAAVGLHVLALRRVAIGGVSLDPSLAPGECRELAREELTEITGKGSA